LIGLTIHSLMVGAKACSGCLSPGVFQTAARSEFWEKAYELDA
jgi:hypothetical protein